VLQAPLLSHSVPLAHEEPAVRHSEHSRRYPIGWQWKARQPLLAWLS
jgi:hypothetical protein